MATAATATFGAAECSDVATAKEPPPPPAEAHRAPRLWNVESASSFCSAVRPQFALDKFAGRNLLLDKLLAREHKKQKNRRKIKETKIEFEKLAGAVDGELCDSFAGMAWQHASSSFA